MGERSDQIEQDIHRTRTDLNENLNELEDKVRKAFNWRNQVKEHPMLTLSIALGGGVLAATLIPVGRRKRYDREWVKKNARRAAERVSAAVGNGKPAYNSIDALKGALMTVAAGRCGGIIGDLIAGYRDELRRVKLAQRRVEI